MRSGAAWIVAAAIAAGCGGGDGGDGASGSGSSTAAPGGQPIAAVAPRPALAPPSNELLAARTEELRKTNGMVGVQQASAILDEVERAGADALPIAALLVAHPSRTIRERAYQMVLAHPTDDRALRIFARRFMDERDISALRTAGSRAVPPLLAAIRETLPRCADASPNGSGARSKIMGQLRVVRDLGVVPAVLIECLSDVVRAECARIAATKGGADITLVSHAVETLGELGAPAVPAITPFAEDAHFPAPSAVIAAITRLGPDGRPLRGALLRMLAAPRYGEGLAIARALLAVAPDDPEVAAALAHYVYAHGALGMVLASWDPLGAAGREAFVTTLLAALRADPSRRGNLALELASLASWLQAEHPNADLFIPLAVEVLAVGDNQMKGAEPALLAFGGRAAGPLVTALAAAATAHDTARVDLLQRMLHQIGEPAFPALAEMARSTGPLEGRTAALATLRRQSFDHESARAPVLAALDDADPAVRRYAYETVSMWFNTSGNGKQMLAVGTPEHERIWLLVIRGAVDVDPKVRAYIGGCASSLSSPAHSVRLSALLDLLDLARTRKQPLAAVALLLESIAWDGDHAPTVERVLGLTTDADPAVRASGARVLGAGAARGGIPKLTALLQDTAPEVRAAAATALAKVGEPGPRTALEARLRAEKVPEVQTALRRAIEALKARAR